MSNTATLKTKSKNEIKEKTIDFFTFPSFFTLPAVAWKKEKMDMQIWNAVRK